MTNRIHGDKGVRARSTNRWPNRAQSDLLIVLVTTAVVAVAAISLDLFESGVETSTFHEAYELDGILVVIFILAICISWYSYRRWVEAQDEIARRIQAESAEKKLREQLAQAQKLKAVGELAGGIAHNFNNLLTIIEGYGYRAQSNLRDESCLRDSITHILNASERGANLTQQLLLFSRQKSVTKSVNSVASLMASVRSLIGDTLPELYDLQFKIDVPTATLKTDPNEFVQAILNLVLNARDAMPNGGRILVTADRAEGMGDWLRLSVRDQGCGMDEETLNRIFEPFLSTKEVGEGTGLGLAMVHGFVTGSGGRVEVSSQVSQGTEISLYFPTVHAGDESAERSMPAVTEGSQARGETVLVVEDDETILRLFKEQLEQFGYKVLTASNGVRALALEETYAGPIDILLTDINMPEMNGIDLANSFRRLRPDAKITVISGYPNDAKQSATWPEGAVILRNR